MEQLKLDFYYGQEAEQFTFYRLPKILITDKRFKELTDSAKLLYGLMLDRMTLSAKNGWYDDENRVYIKYSFSSIMNDLNCGKEKASKLLKELEDIGLIYKVSKIGYASIIYVKNFVSVEVDESDVDVDEEADEYTEENVANQFEKQTGTENRQVKKGEICPQTSSVIEPVLKTDQSDILTSACSKIEPKVVRKTNINNNILSDNKFKENNSINPDGMDGLICDVTEAAAYMELIKTNIDYDVYMSDDTWTDREVFDDLYQLICEVVCVPRKTIRIAGNDFPYSVVKSQFLKLNSEHIKYVISCLSKNTTKISNIKAYLITALYNAPSTMRSFYNAEVNHDIFGG